MMARFSTKSGARNLSEPHPRALIIGYGNPLLSDDGAGCVAAGILEKIFRLPSIEVISSHQLTPEMAESCSLSDLVIFVDASRGSTPGEISCVPVPDTSPEAEASGRASAPTLPSFSHHLTPGTLLATSWKLYGKAPAAYLLSIAGESFDPGEELSAAVQAKLPQLLDRARTILGTIFSDLPDI